MQRRQLRLLSQAVGAIVCIWLLCWAGITVARNSRMTADKIRLYVHSLAFSKLSPAERSAALLALAAKLNSLTREERLQARLDEVWKPWFAQMTEGEREQFIEATLPTDVKQMIESFERMPDDKRKKTIEDAMKNLKKPPVAPSTNNAIITDTNSPGYLNPALAQRAETLGLKTFYTESSAETKAELAPLLEEVQRQMESGRAFR
jgi:hypothetical protein